MKPLSIILIFYFGTLYSQNTDNQFVPFKNLLIDRKLDGVVYKLDSLKYNKISKLNLLKIQYKIARFSLDNGDTLFAKKVMLSSMSSKKLKDSTSKEIQNYNHLICDLISEIYLNKNKLDSALIYARKAQKFKYVYSCSFEAYSGRLFDLMHLAKIYSRKGDYVKSKNLLTKNEYYQDLHRESETTRKKYYEELFKVLIILDGKENVQKRIKLAETNIKIKKGRFSDFGFTKFYSFEIILPVNDFNLFCSSMFDINQLEKLEKLSTGEILKYNFKQTDLYNYWNKTTCP